NTRGPDPYAVAEATASSAFYLAMYTFAVAGVLIARPQPRNPIGWILLAIGAVWAAPAESVVRYGMVTAPGSIPHADVIAVLTSSSWVPGFGLIGTFLLLLFPDGHLPSPRWRPVAWASAASLLVVTLIIPLAPLPLRDVASYGFLPRTPNPLGVEALRPVADQLYGLALLVPLSMLACASALVVRFRRALGQERRQLLWLAAAGAVTAGAYLMVGVLTFAYGGAAWADERTPPWLATLQHVVSYVFVLIPIAVGVAVLRHRLYDIDVIINRALVYTGLTLALAAVYLAGVLGLGAVVRAVSGQEHGSLPVAVSTLAVAALFAPLRRRMQALIDRRFYRRKYDAQRAVTEFADGLRDRVDLTSLHGALIATVATTIQPASVSLWLKPSRGRRPR
ncbi:MAG TPA: hypothetical protein VK875_04615, partial [Euzebyales bacterium]|nr:hypothetical protein [Euzebyales bacterium]